MPVSLIVNGIVYAYPVTNDDAWGTIATDWASAISQESFYRSGGLFTLTKDANFGPFFGLKASYFSGRGANTATTGFIRLQHNHPIVWRNAANTGDMSLTPNATNVLFYNNLPVISLNAYPILKNTNTSIISHGDSGVQATGYGDSSHIPVFVVNSMGHVVSVSNVAVETGVGAIDVVARDRANAAFAQANTANVTGQAAFDKANGAIYTADQIRANISNTAPINYDSSNGIISHALSGAAASGYGDAATVPKVVVDDKGHVTSVTNTSIAISAAQVTSGTLAVARGGTGQTAITVNGSLLIGNTVSGGFDVTAISQTAPVIVTNDKGSITLSHASSGVTASGYGDAATVPKVVVDVAGHLTSVTNTSIVFPLPTKWIEGLAWAPGGGANTVDFTAGSCRDATDVQNISVAALTKKANVAWAVGTNAGMLDTGSIANGNYYIWAIKRSDTGVTDFLSSLSSTAPVMPASYDFKRLMGFFEQAAGAISGFDTYEAGGGGIILNWRVPTLDLDISTFTTSRRTDAMRVPLHFSVVAQLNFFFSNAAIAQGWIYCPDQTDTAPSATVAPLCNLRNPVAGVGSGGELHIRTNSTGTVASRASTSSSTLRLSTMGFQWARKN